MVAALFERFQLFSPSSEAVAVEFGASEHICDVIAERFRGTADAIKDFFGASVHPAYSEAIRRQLNRLDVNKSVAELERQVHSIQQRARQLTEQGTPVRNVDGATVELWERLLNQ